MSREPVLIVMSVLAALQALTATGALTDVMPAKWAALTIAVVAAAQFGMAFYVRGKVQPVK